MNIVFLIDDSYHSYDSKGSRPIYLTGYLAGLSEGTLLAQQILAQQIALAMQLAPKHLIFCIKLQNIANFHVVNVIKQLVPTAHIIPIVNSTRGALCMSMLAAEYIDNDDELLLLTADYIIEQDKERERDNVKLVSFFRQYSADMGLLAFHSLDNCYPGVRINEKGEVMEAAEKSSISQNALVPFYYYRQGQYFLECAKMLIRKDTSIDRSFHLSAAVNEMLLRSKKIVLHKINCKHFHPLKTQAHLLEYLGEHETYKESK